MLVPRFGRFEVLVRWVQLPPELHISNNQNKEKTYDWSIPGYLWCFIKNSSFYQFSRALYNSISVYSFFLYYCPNSFNKENTHGVYFKFINNNKIKTQNQELRSLLVARCTWVLKRPLLTSAAKMQRMGLSSLTEKTRMYNHFQIL